MIPIVRGHPLILLQDNILALMVVKFAVIARQVAPGAVILLVERCALHVSMDTIVGKIGLIQLLLITTIAIPTVLTEQVIINIQDNTFLTQTVVSVIGAVRYVHGVLITVEVQNVLLVFKIHIFGLTIPMQHIFTVLLVVPIEGLIIYILDNI